MGRIEVRDFDGDLAVLADLAYGTLLDERGAGTWLDLNRPEAARLIFADVPDPRFLIGAYDGTRLVAFIANLPRTYRLNGQTYRAVVPTMLAAHRDYRGAVVYLLAECLRRNREFGADLALFYLERGSRSWRMFEQVLRPTYRIERVKTLHARVRVVDLARVAHAQNVSGLLRTAGQLIGLQRPITAPAVTGVVRPYQDADLDAIQALLQRQADRDCLVRVFTQPALARRLHTPPMTTTLVYERSAAVRGFVNFTVHELLSRRGRQRWAWLDFLAWDGLGGSERQALLAGLWQASRAQSCIGIVEWSKGYYGPGPLWRAGFFPYPLRIEVNAWLFNPALSLRNVTGLCEQVV